MICLETFNRNVFYLGFLHIRIIFSGSHKISLIFSETSKFNGDYDYIPKNCHFKFRFKIEKIVYKDRFTEKIVEKPVYIDKIVER